MSGELAYVDSSALVKTFKAEPESGAIVTALSEWPDLVSSYLIVPEVLRVGRLTGLWSEARAVVDALGKLPLTPAIRDRSAYIGSDNLRALDAIHLATAEALEAGLGVIFTYDDRMIEGASLEGLPYRAPLPEP